MRMPTKEEIYIFKRLGKAKLQSTFFYLFRFLPIRRRKIVFCCIEGTTGYTCNPKYIAEELLVRNEHLEKRERYEMVWLVNNTAKEFPCAIKAVRNTLINRAFHLSTAHFWIDNSRKQLEVRKRKGQVYIQTWHAKLGFKPTCLDRGKSFSRIAYLVSKHDSDLVDYWLSNSDWYDKTLQTGSLYEGETLRTGSPRCDVLVKVAENPEYQLTVKTNLCRRLGIKASDSELPTIHFLMYAPTFRGGSQGTDRSVEVGSHFPDYDKLVDALQERFGGTWYVLLRLHPQLVARNLDGGMEKGRIRDVSRVDDMYEILAGCEAFMTDYSSAAFDAAVMKIPVFIYADDYAEYEKERGSLLWNLRQLPFPLAQNDDELEQCVRGFRQEGYRLELEELFCANGVIESGQAAEKVVEFIEGKV